MGADRWHGTRMMFDAMILDSSRGDYSERHFTWLVVLRAASHASSYGRYG
jgi:hypothetical protein